MAEKSTSNRFGPLSSPTSSPTATRTSSPSRSDASQPSSSTSRPLSASSQFPSTSYRYRAGRLDTYPETWTHTNVTPRQLATCGFSYKEPTTSEIDKCFCHVCEIVLSMKGKGTVGQWSNDALLSLHDEDCVLADTIFDMIRSMEDIYTHIDHTGPRTAEALPSTPSSLPQQLTPPPPVKSPQTCPPPACTAPSLLPSTPTSTSTSIPSLPSRSCSTSSARPSYAAVASREPTTSPSPTSPPPTSQPRRSPTSTTSAPKTTPSHHSLPYVSSPVLSVRDLERRFQTQSKPLQSQHSFRPKPATTDSALTRLLHAVADIIGPHSQRHFSTRSRYPTMWH